MLYKINGWRYFIWSVQYENASWQEVSRLMVVGDIDIDPVYEAYVESLKWFRDLFAPEEK